MSEASETARLLLDLRDDHPKLAGIHTRAARLLLTGQPPSDRTGCRRCGDPLAQNPRGRPRVWCSESCRDKSRK